MGRSLPGVGSPTQRNVMFGIFGKKARRAAVEIKKFEKRDLAQAVINAAYLVAYADGECEAS
ncbi:tellurite resistance protein, partial [Escherichia coli]